MYKVGAVGQMLGEVDWQQTPVGGALVVKRVVWLTVWQTMHERERGRFITKANQLGAYVA